PMTESEQTTTAVDIDQSIAGMEQFYRAVTGREASSPETAYAPIPAEKDPVEHVERQLNQLLELLGGADTAQPAWLPPMSVWASEKEILVRMDLPGVPRDQVRVSVQSNVLTISGTRPAPEDARFRPWLQECLTGRFRRTLLVPGGLRSAEPAAEMKSGVLEIRIAKPVSETTTPKSVRVN